MTAQIRPLTADEIGSGEMWNLLADAAGVDTGALRQIRDTELPTMRVFGAVDRRVIGFAAVALRPDLLELEYLAVDASARGSGLGTRLIDAARRLDASLPLHAHTDDDAVDFYRALGFEVTRAPRDARWPDRERYACTLAALSGTLPR